MNFMKNTILLFFVLVLGQAKAQNIIVWSELSPLKLTDFAAKAPSSSNSIYGCRASCNIDFGYQMSAASFMLTKNFNSKVKTVFIKNTSYIVAPDANITQNLLAYSQTIFDLTELYARKFRQRLFEQKKAFSNSDFYVAAQEEVQKELSERENFILSSTNLGQNTEELKKTHDQILQEIQQLADYCMECKPKKK